MNQHNQKIIIFINFDTFENIINFKITGNLLYIYYNWRIFKFGVDFLPIPGCGGTECHAVGLIRTLKGPSGVFEYTGTEPNQIQFCCLWLNHEIRKSLFVCDIIFDILKTHTRFYSIMVNQPLKYFVCIFQNKVYF